MITELVIKSPTVHGLLKVMAESRVVVAIDEMHNASDGFVSSSLNSSRLAII
jgi:hypothetical protein